MGVARGWLAGKALHARLPNPWASVVLLAGVLGGPLLTAEVLGQSLLSHALALGIAGVAIGVNFWPLGERPGQPQTP